MKKTLKNQKGFTLVEAMLAITIIAIVSLAIINVQSFMSNQSVMIRKKAFATQKAIQMMEELRALVAGAEQEQINVLDNYNDGSTFYNCVLTTNQSVTDPGNPLSGNVSLAGNWKYLRQVSVIKDPNDPYTRHVTVDVYSNNPSNPGQPLETLAETSALLRTIISNPVPTQVLDVYVIAIESVPGWWTNLSTMIPTWGNVLENLELLNPGLQIRETWITRMGFGRDQQYTPYINEATPTNTTIMPYIYFYPGNMTESASGGGTDGTSYDYYTASVINGQEIVDGAQTNVNSYPLCDTFNNCVRYPDEVSLYNNVYNPQAGGNLTYSLRMLLEDMNTNPSKYKNAIFVNLHGELLPIPPIRNYSDAAKSPAMFPYQRIVTHPENLQYASAADTINLRVYPYLTNVSSVGVLGVYSQWSTPSTPPKDLSSGITTRLTRYDRNINFYWSGAGNPPNPKSPYPTIGVDTFTVCWTGYITPEYTGNYTFETVTEDGVELYLNGNNIIDDWNDQAATPQYSQPQSLSANTTYYIEMHYYQDGGVATSQLYWECPSQNLSLELVPFDRMPLATVYSTDTVIPGANITITEILGGPDGAYQKIIATQTVSYNVTNPTPGSTLITLYDTPIFNSTSSVTNYGGLWSTQTLYGLQYIPCPVGADFSLDLSTGGNYPKNTARWIISFAPNTFTNGMHMFQTCIGSPNMTTGIPQYSPPNLSNTYIWVNQSPPYTEQYQYMGDPRHCPYLDVKNKNNYNWYFTQVPTVAGGYSGFDKTTAANSAGMKNGNGWYGIDSGDNNQMCDVDLPRFYLTYRNALLGTQSIWTTLNGWGYYYFGMGGEMGMNQSPFWNGLPFMKQPWETGTDTTGTKNIDEIYGGPQSLVASTDNTWFAKSWLGELYPDQDYATWQSTGNLPTGQGNFWRTYHKTSFPQYFTYNRSVCAGQNGCASFYNGQPAANQIFETYSYDSSYGPPAVPEFGDITNLGTNMSVFFSEPLLTPIAADRPFNIAASAVTGAGGNEPPEWGDATYSGIRTTLSIPSTSSGQRIYYTSEQSNSENASAIVQVVLGTSTFFVSANGLTTQTGFGTIQMGGFIVMNMIRSFLDAGLYAGQNHIPQLPYVQITYPLVTTSLPSSTTQIPITWTAQWLNWVGQLYTADYTAGYTESVPLVYNVKYFDGTNWRFCQDDTIAQEGVYDSTSNHSNSITVTAGGGSYTWASAGLAGLTKGVGYILCVEAYRQGYPLHYGYDQVPFTISQ